MVVAEISPAVIQAAPLFDPGNLAASKQPEAPDRARRRLPHAAAQRRPLRPDRLGAQQSVGDRHRDALQPRVPGGGARPPDARRCPRAVVPQLRDRHRDDRAGAAHLRVGLRARGGLVHGGKRPAADRAARSRDGDSTSSVWHALRAPGLPGGLRARQDRVARRRCSRTRSCRSACSRRRRCRASCTRCCTRVSATWRRAPSSSESSARCPRR